VLDSCELSGLFVFLSAASYVFLCLVLIARVARKEAKLKQQRRQALESQWLDVRIKLEDFSSCVMIAGFV
jgi:hypothetical protein